MFKFVLLILLCSIQPIYGDPWGKDADLAYCPLESISTPDREGIFVVLSEILIGFHQNVISPCDGPRSHFKPSSSQYTLDAIHKYGFFRGFLLGCDRLMRENDEEWIYRTTRGNYNWETKYDPVR